jgi:hypothetical protein
VQTFRFRVYDPQKKKERAGTLQAKDEVTARKLIKKNKLEVISLSAEATLEFKASEEGPRILTFDAPTQTEYKPTLSERFSDAFRLGFYQILVLASVGAIGLLLMFASLLQSSGKEQANKHRDFRAVIQGRVTGMDRFELKRGKYTIRLPEIPWRRVYSGEELLQSGGQFEISLDMSSKKIPKTMEFWAEVPGAKPERITNISLLEEPTISKIPPLFLTRRFD